MPVPAVIKQYNSGMGGVDLLDNLVACYRIPFRTIEELITNNNLIFVFNFILGLIGIFKAKYLWKILSFIEQTYLTKLCLLNLQYCLKDKEVVGSSIFLVIEHQ